MRVAETRKSNEGYPSYRSTALLYSNSHLLPAYVRVRCSVVLVLVVRLLHIMPCDIHSPGVRMVGAVQWVAICITIDLLLCLVVLQHASVLVCFPTIIFSSVPPPLILYQGPLLGSHHQRVLPLSLLRVLPHAVFLSRRRLFAACSLKLEHE